MIASGPTGLEIRLARDLPFGGPLETLVASRTNIAVPFNGAPITLGAQSDFLTYARSRAERMRAAGSWEWSVTGPMA